MNDNQNTESFNVNQNQQQQTQVPYQNYNGQPNAPYNGGYNPYGMPPKKKNNNTLIIVLAAVLAVLIVILITVTVLFVTRDNTIAPTDEPAIENPVDEDLDEDSIDEPLVANETYVTCVSNAQIFVRSGPDKSYSVILAINGGDTSVKLKSTGNTTLGSDGYIWYEVNIPSGTVAWVRSDIVTVDGPNPYQRPAQYTENGTGNTLVTRVYNSQIFVRSGPGKNYSKVLVINPGDTSVKLRYTGTSQYGTDGYIWYKVVIPSGSYAWVRSDIVVFR